MDSIYENQLGILWKPMLPTRFGNWKGWVLLQKYQLYVLVMSTQRFSAGTVLSVEKTLNDDWWWTRVEQTRFINGMDDEPDASGWVQGQLFS